MPKFLKTNFNLLLTCNSILEVSNFIRKESICRFSTFSTFNYKTSILKNYVKSQTNCRYLMVASSDLKNYYTVSLTKPSSGQKFSVKGKEGDSILDVVKNNDLDIPGFGACDGTISCSTCHLIFKKEDFGKIDSPITDDEIDMLTLAKDCCDT
ncbi:Adrenodoxin, mitochondrial [Armadillidium vulgare]|nr:Adrenodoxin, mitochondrial [Armadillidium vulgare]